ncbi:PIN domain-containing protein [Schaalia vaccimaxillae]|uniref:PIN domain-containing protein n=1 Tax=Schaalia vaccimaxillae TaxID=183916 RepID=UPI0003B448E9|nr:PIN domain-containing protein [Schaalia vaccimaxillae]
MLYLDTSFAGLILLDQEHSIAAESMLLKYSQSHALVSSVLLELELTRLARRTGLNIRAVHAFTDALALVSIDEEVIAEACALTGSLKSLDAIHLATAKILDSVGDPVIVATHDIKLAHACQSRSLQVLSPTSEIPSNATPAL